MLIGKICLFATVVWNVLEFQSLFQWMLIGKFLGSRRIKVVHVVSILVSMDVDWEEHVGGQQLFISN